MKPLTVSQSAEIAAFAETYAEKRFGVAVEVTITCCAAPSKNGSKATVRPWPFVTFVVFLLAPFAFGASNTA